jgi:hypothetical protein
MKRDTPFYSTVSKNLIALHHLRELSDRLKKKGLEILFFRGISLLGDVYPLLGDRGMLDVDVLVREKDIGRFKKILTELGLKEIESGTFSKRGLLLDVHTSFLNPSRTILERSCLNISIHDVFKKSIDKELDGLPIKTPCPVHLFLSTAIHLQSHTFGSKKGWKDLVRIKQYFGLSDKEIISEAIRMGAERTLYYLNGLRPDLFPYEGWKFSLGERWILKRIKGEKFNQNFGDLLFLFQSKKKMAALKEIFFPQGISARIIVDRFKKSLLLIKDILFGSKT